MVRVNCAAIPATLIESGLFGREKGAYTGALSRRRSGASNSPRDRRSSWTRLVTCRRRPGQALRVLEDGNSSGWAARRPAKVDTRIIAATHRDLEKRIEADTFREDLYYRLNVFPIRVPPAREDRGHSHAGVALRRGLLESVREAIESIAKDNIEMLQRYPWPGNVRELRNVVERAMIVANGPRLTIALPHRGPPPPRDAA